MPLFFYLSGIVARGRTDSAGVIRKRVRTLLVPYFLWSLFVGALMVMAGGQTNGTYSWARLGTIAYEPIAPYWFLYALFFHAVILRLVPEKAHVPAAVVVFLLAYLVPGTVLFQIGWFLPFTVLGLRYDINLNGAWPWLGALSLGLYLAAFIAAGAQIGGMFPVPLYFSPLSLPATASGLILTIALAHRFHASRVLAELGRSSMAIFVMHIPAAAATRIALDHLIPDLSIWMVLLASLVAGVLIPLPAQALLNRLRLGRILGLER